MESLSCPNRKRQRKWGRLGILQILSTGSIWSKRGYSEALLKKIDVGWGRLFLRRSLLEYIWQFLYSSSALWIHVWLRVSHSISNALDGLIQNEASQCYLLILCEGSDKKSSFPGQQIMETYCSIKSGGICQDSHSSRPIRLWFMTLDVLNIYEWFLHWPLPLNFNSYEVLINSDRKYLRSEWARHAHL